MTDLESARLRREPGDRLAGACGPVVVFPRFTYESRLFGQISPVPGAGYVGWRLAKGGSNLRINPSDSLPWGEAPTGKLAEGRIIHGYIISFKVPSEEKGQELIDQLLPVFQQLTPRADIDAYYWGPAGLVKQAHFSFGEELTTYDELRSRYEVAMEMAKMLVDFPLEFAASPYFEGPKTTPKKKTRRTA